MEHGEIGPTDTNNIFANFLIAGVSVEEAMRAMADGEATIFVHNASWNDLGGTEPISPESPSS